MRSVQTSFCFQTRMKARINYLLVRKSFRCFQYAVPVKIMKSNEQLECLLPKAILGETKDVLPFILLVSV